MRKNTGKRIASFFTVLLLVLASLAAQDDAGSVLHVTARVPENYGVAFPDSALRFGDFVFEVKFNLKLESGVEFEERDDCRALLSNDRLSIGDLQPGLGNFSFTLVYYGNLSKPYRTEVLIDPNPAWRLEGNEESSVPIEVTMKRNDSCDPDVACQSYRDGQVYIEIPPAGPRSDVPVLDVEVSWDGGLDLIPGNYSTDLHLNLRTV